MIVGIDVGGTFTDIVFFDGRRLCHEKIPSIPHAPHEAVREGIALLGDRKIDCLIHGTTLRHTDSGGDSREVV
jgi:N-methylhydantoinase A